MIADSSTSLDRAADLRVEPGVLDRLRADDATRVIAVRDGRVRISGNDLDPAALLRVPASEIVDATWALLGRDGDGSALLLAVLPPEGDTVDAAPEEVWLGLRDLGARLDSRDTELLIEALALGGWLRDAPFCPRCGGGTEVRQAGWSRRCLVCGREHFPRTDPAVIVAVESSDGERLLLGANANWGGRMYSCFAGFTEAGESLESTVHRELEEESGVRLASLRYVASQPWPFPRSLMLGFRAVALDDHVLRPDGEEIIDVRWFTRDEIGSALAGDGPVGLPGPASIARALILEWFEERA
ncbi:NAD(+) diphosphatase [Microbacterium sp. NPDC088619]|uniref:NAD(+) diphosphatase n=1 Tax=Microbacterium sp. NPDC088619 TaxID=3364196 RepID=UPI003819EAA1